MTIPDESPGTLAAEAVSRSLRRRRDAAEHDVSRMLEAGREILSTGANPRVADIVKAASLSNEAFYRYFGSKGDFVAAVVEDGAKRLAAYVTRSVPEGGTPDEQIRAVIEAVMSQAVKPHVASATRNILAQARPHGSGPGFEGTLAGLLRGPITAAGSQDPGRDAAVAAGAVVSCLTEFLWSQRTPTTGDIDHLTGFVLRAVRRP